MPPPQQQPTLRRGVLARQFMKKFYIVTFVARPMEHFLPKQ